MFFTRIINFMIPMWDRSIVLTQDSNKTGGLYSTFIYNDAGLFTLTGIGFAPFRILDMYSQSSARDLKRVHSQTWDMVVQAANPGTESKGWIAGID